jgi:hypothetical protein
MTYGKPLPRIRLSRGLNRLQAALATHFRPRYVGVSALGYFLSTNFNHASK